MPYQHHSLDFPLSACMLSMMATTDMAAPPLNLGPANVDARLAPTEMDALVTGFARLKVVEAGQFPLRPDFGKAGTPIKLRANYFAMKAVPQKFFEYDVKVRTRMMPRMVNNTLTSPQITPGVSNRRVKKRLYNLLEETEAFLPYANHSANDGSSKLISAIQIPLGPTGEMEISVKHYDEEASEDDPTSKIYTLSFTYVKEYDTSEMQK